MDLRDLPPPRSAQPAPPPPRDPSRALAWVSVGAAVVSGVLFLLPLSTTVLGVPDSCGNVLGYLTGGDNHVDSFSLGVCLPTIHRHALYAFVALGAAAVALFVWVSRRVWGPGVPQRGAGSR